MDFIAGNIHLLPFISMTRNPRSFHLRGYFRLLHDCFNWKEPQPFGLFCFPLHKVGVFDYFP